MIDLRKPLEGVPGLLLLAALVLFGATIGVSLALGFSWVEIKHDSVVGFLGNVVGAGLGAALAVMGAVYVQRQERRERLTPPTNNLRLLLRRLRASTLRLASALEAAATYPDLEDVDKEACKAAIELQAQVAALPDLPELPRALHERLVVTRQLLRLELDIIVEDLTNPRDEPQIRYDQAWRSIEEKTLKSVEQLMAAIDAS